MRGILRRLRRVARDFLARAQRRIGREAGGAIGRRAAFRAPFTVTLAASDADLEAAAKTIDSILAGTVAPEQIVLWLAGDGAAAERLVARGVEIRRAKSAWPATGGLFEAPGAGSSSGRPVVVARSGVLYPRNWLERLYRESLIYPRAILALRCRQAAPGSEFAGWPDYAGAECRLDLVPLGRWGVLYPPHLLATLDASPDGAPDDEAATDLWLRTLSLEARVPVRCLGEMREYRSTGPAAAPPVIPNQVLERFAAVLEGAAGGGS